MDMIVEADELLYTVAFSHEKQAYVVKYKDGRPDDDMGITLTQTEIRKALFEDGLYQEKHFTLHPYKIIEEDFNIVISDLDSRIKNLKLLQLETSAGVLTGIDKIEFWLSPSDHSNFRYKIASIAGQGGVGYKVNRSLKTKPKHLQGLKDYLKEKYGAKEALGHEADDALGWSANTNTVLVHQDKDIDMIPGWHFNPVKNETYYVKDDLGTLELKTKVSPNNKGKTHKLVGRGLIQFYAQLLLGDPTDNIPGIKGIGHKGAYEYLKDCVDEQEAFNKVRYQFILQYTMEYADSVISECADLLWICRAQGETGSCYLKNKGFL